MENTTFADELATLAERHETPDLVRSVRCPYCGAAVGEDCLVARAGGAPYCASRKAAVARAMLQVARKVRA